MTLANVCQAGEVALIIDDMGNTRADEKAFNLPAQVTFAILPHTPYSKEFSQRSDIQGREVMLHMPMESLAGTYPGPGTITSSMVPQLITQKLQSALTDIPNAVGINNHMGSKLTQLTLPMETTMSFLKQHGLYFVDSRTTRYSRAEKIAHENGVVSWHRNVFIDHTLNESDMQRQFDRLMRIAQRYKRAVGIGHPHPKTLRFLQQRLPLLERAGIKLIPVSDLFSGKAASYLLAKQKDSPQPSSISVSQVPEPGAISTTGTQ
ncbi:divergent polysaccharide deacetylase family protein [Neptunicella marina]|uniref:Divergent polysaccharide deacetylase family protein n=2 Tax=Neptunicella marina TaxID=2125989 RepID=A0A8J6M6B4_9ALTE|nr:divergent polysaccharide deacetylase family protein [Neptunicella marina]